MFVAAPFPPLSDLSEVACLYGFRVDLKSKKHINH